MNILRTPLCWKSQKNSLSLHLKPFYNSLFIYQCHLHHSWVTCTFYVCTCSLQQRFVFQISIGHYQMQYPLSIGEENKYLNCFLHALLDQNTNYNMIDVSNSLFDLKWTPLYEWWMRGCESHNAHLKDTCWKMIISHALNLLTIQDTKVNIIGDFSKFLGGRGLCY